MFKPYKGICIQCDKDKWIQNSKGICPDCIFKNNHQGKSRQQIYLERQKKKKIKVTGEWALFMIIWEERKHICHNCKYPLGNIPKAWMFMHIKGKKLYNELRLVKTNIELSCFKCHYAYDFQGMDKYNERKDLHLKG